MPKQTNKNKQPQTKKGGKQQQKKQTPKAKSITEKKPKKPIQKSTKQNAVAKYKNKTSKATSLLATGAKMDGRKVLSQKQIAIGKETHQYKASAKRIKQLQRNGVPKKAIQEMLRKEAKAAKNMKKKQNKKFGVKQ